MVLADVDFCLPQDVDELYEVEKLCFDDAWSRSSIEYDVAGPGLAIYLKAVLKDAIVGYGVLGFSGNVACLMNLAVLPDYRGLGIGLQLMGAFDILSREEGCGRMRLEVRSSNRQARDFYASLGFVYQKRNKGYYANGEDAIVMVARLPIKYRD